MPSAREVLIDASTSSAERDELERLFFRYLLLPNGTYKTTGANRLVDFDRWAQTFLSPRRPQRCLDVAMSSGTTTVDWIEGLNAAGVETEVTGCDVCVNAWIRPIGFGSEILLDAAGAVLQLATPVLTKGRPHDPDRSLPRRALQRILESIERSQRRLKPGTGPRDMAIQLLSRRARECVQFDPVEHDITTFRPQWFGSFDVIRAANILNLGYFPSATLTRMLGFLRSYLVEDGILLLVRTDDEHKAQNGTAFRNSRKSLEMIGRVGTGSEVESLALSTE